MIIYILWILIIILSFLLIKLLGIKKNTLICLFISLIIVLFVLNLETSINSAIEGCILWFKGVLPTIFPFAFICNLLISYDGINLYSKFLGPLLCKPLRLSKCCAFPILVSILCGYPLGAKYASDLFSLGYIDRKEYERLLNIATNAGPIFIIGTVGLVMLKNIKYGYILLIANYLSMILIGFLTIHKASPSKDDGELILERKASLGDILKDALQNAISTSLTVGGFIVVFSILINIINSSSIIINTLENINQLLSLPPKTLYSVFLGSVEMTNGCNLISNSALTIPLKLSFISFLMSFSGLSIIGQVTSFTSKNNIPLFKYTSLKFIQGVLSFIITYLASIFFIKEISASTIIIESTLTSSIYLIPLALIAFTYILFKTSKKLFFH